MKPGETTLVSQGKSSSYSPRTNVFPKRAVLFLSSVDLYSHSSIVEPLMTEIARLTGATPDAFCLFFPVPSGSTNRLSMKKNVSLIPA